MKRNIFILAILAIVLLLGSCTRDRGPRPVPGPSFYQYIEEYDNDRRGWSFADQANRAYGVVSNGSYKMAYNDDLQPAYYISQNIGFNRFDDFTIYTRIGSDNMMGLLFGFNSSTRSYGYSFTIDYDGYYALYDEGGNGYGGDIVELVPPTTNSFVRRNGDYNELRLEQRSGRWLGYVNNALVFNIKAQNLNGTNVGYVLLPFTQGEADYLQVDWYY